MSDENTQVTLEEFEAFIKAINIRETTETVTLRANSSKALKVAQEKWITGNLGNASHWKKVMATDAAEFNLALYVITANTIKNCYGELFVTQDNMFYVRIIFENVSCRALRDVNNK